MYGKFGCHGKQTSILQLFAITQGHTHMEKSYSVKG